MRHEILAGFAKIFGQTSRPMPSLQRDEAVSLAALPAGGAAPRLVDWQTHTPNYPPANVRTYRGAGYRGNDVFRACVDLLAESTIQGALEIVDRATRKAIEGPHPMLEMIRTGGRSRPVPGNTASTLLGSMVRDLYTDGNAILEKIRDARGNVVELWRLDPAKVGIVPQHGGIGRYVYDVAGTWFDIPPENIVHWLLPDPDQPWFGVPPIVAAVRDLAIANGLADHTKITIQNWAVPPVVIASEQVLSPQQAQEGRDAWKRTYGGQRQGEVAVFGAGMTAKVIGLNMKDLAAVELAGLADDAICAVHRVPPILIAGGSKGDPTRSNYEEAEKQLWFDAVIPLQKRMAEVLELFVLAEFDADRDPYGFAGAPLCVGWNNAGVEVLARAALARGKDAAEVFRSGMVSRHHAQGMAGIEVHGPNVIYRPGTVGGIVGHDSDTETMLEDAL